MFGFNTLYELIDLVTVFDAILDILMSRQMCEKLQCLNHYENLMSNNYHNTAVLKKNINCKQKLQSKELS